jgi:hypothetical protein
MDTKNLYSIRYNKVHGDKEYYFRRSRRVDCQINILYSEDLQNGQKIRNLTIVNPFI